VRRKASGARDRCAPSHWSSRSPIANGTVVSLGTHDGRRCDITGVVLILLPPLGTTALRLRRTLGTSAVRAVNYSAVFALAERTG